MIPNTNKDRMLASRGVVMSGEFGISSKDTVHLMTIMRSTLYSDKVLAVLREYSANAWDSHRQAGKPDLPIEVKLPTTIEPTLSIRDYGVGLSVDDVFQVFSQYGASTKRESDVAVGMLGIGSKSAFSYSDTFSITSWHEGFKRAFVAALDKTGRGIINLLHEEPCRADESGVQIEIAVQPKDIDDFRKKAALLFPHFNPPPKINLPLLRIDETFERLKNGIVASGEKIYVADSRDAEWVASAMPQWTAVMGCIPYRINLSHFVTGDVSEVVPSYIRNLTGIIYMDIGEVHVNASREDLEYSAFTKKAIVRRLNALIDEFITLSLNRVLHSSSPMWKKRLDVQALRRMRIPFPNEKAFGHFCAEVDLQKYLNDVDHFDLSALGTARTERSSSVRVAEETRLIIKDDKRSLRGFNFHSTVRLVIPEPGSSLEQVEEELAKLIKDANIEGVPVSRTSAEPWVAPLRAANGRNINPKHRSNAFVLSLKGHHYARYPYSSCWEAVDREPQPDDVFVVLSEFQPVNDSRFFYKREEDEDLVKHFGGKLPPIYGYKSTNLRPVDSEKCVGIPYSQWREKFLSDFLTPERLKSLNQYYWAGILPKMAEHSTEQQNDVIKFFIDRLGVNHDITSLHLKCIHELRTLRKAADLEDKGRESLIRNAGLVLEADVALKKIESRYSLMFRRGNGLRELYRDSEEYVDLWFNYIKAIDCAVKHGEL